MSAAERPDERVEKAPMSDEEQAPMSAAKRLKK